MPARHALFRLTMTAAWALSLSACLDMGPVDDAHPVSIDDAAALQSVNAFRSDNGLSPLRTERRLMAAARAQSEAMAGRRDMSHYVDGPLPERIKRFGYPASTAAENIAYGQSDFAAAMAGWEHSAGHRRNLLDPKMTEIGFAAARAATGGPIFWTQIFGRPREAQPAGSTLTFAGVPLPSQ